MAEQPIRVLVVDDTITYRKIISDVLTDMPAIDVVGTAANGKIALAKIEHLRPDILTLDLEMPEMNGLELLAHLKQTGSHVGTIVLSGSSKHGAAATMQALELGAFDFIAKPTLGTLEENTKQLQQELCPKIEACARKSQVEQILRGEQVSAVKASSEPSVAAEDDVVSRMNRIAAEAVGQPEVICIAISTGGPQALNEMLPRLPGDLPVPVLIVQHMPPVFTKSLAEDLDRRCALTVAEAVDGQTVLPGHVLIAPGGKQMKVVKDDGLSRIRITDDPPENSCKPSADYLFRSVTRAYGPNALGLIMTGMGNDGAQGCRQLKQRGATIIAQDEESCVVFGMPREPIEEGIADVVAPLSKIANEIVQRVGKGVTECM